MKKALALILAVLLCVSMLAMTASAGSEILNGEGTADHPYEIGSFEDLKAFSESVKTNDYAGKYIVLTADIVTDSTLDPIGSTGSLNSNSTWQFFHQPFNGTFNGQGHTITLNMTPSFPPPVCDNALFGQIGPDGIVENLYLDGIVKSLGNAAGLCDDNFGLIKNCIVSVTIEPMLGTSMTYVGGICDMNHGDIVNCAFTGTINASSAYSSSLGGIASVNCNNTPSSHIYNCYSNGNIITASAAEIGAIAARNDQSDPDTIYDCYFYNGVIKKGCGFNEGEEIYSVSATKIANGTLEEWINEYVEDYAEDYGELGTWVVVSANEVHFATGDEPAHTHTVQQVAAVPATCTEPGTAAYYTCTTESCECYGKYYADSDLTEELASIVIPAAGHSYNESGVCTVCGDVLLGDMADIWDILIANGPYYEDPENPDDPDAWILWFDLQDGEYYGFDTDEEEYELPGYTLDDGKYVITVDSKTSFEIAINGDQVEVITMHYRKNSFDFYPLPAHTHSISFTEAVPASCTANGTAAYYTCTDPACECYGKYYADSELTEELASIVLPSGHSYGADGICTVCGDKLIAIVSASLRLDENIDVIYTAKVPEGAEASMTFTMNGQSVTVEDDGTHTFAFEGVNPQCMGDNIRAVLNVTLGEDEYSCERAEYSVRAYCVHQLEQYPDDEELTALLSDTLFYGEAAQIYTGYKTEDLVTDDLDIEPSFRILFDGLFGKRVFFTGDCDTDIDWISATLVLSNDLATRFTFTADSIDGLSVDVTIGGRTQTFTEFTDLGNGKYAVTFDGIMATEFDDTVTASFKRSGETVGRTVSYSVNTYICGTQNCGNANLEALVKALYDYGASAKAYADTNK